jgi:hypothetical protein
VVVGVTVGEGVMEGVGLTVGVRVMLGVGVIDGVGVGGGVYSGSPSVLPSKVAYSPHSQQVPERSGLLMIQ